MDTLCNDCKVETNHNNRDDNGCEWYMVLDEIWAYVTRNKPAEILCIGCLEERLGRKLVPEDFSNVFCNQIPGFGRSLRLRDRMGIDLI